MTPERRDKLFTNFRARFGREPTVLARAPGRVNLIGEHTDYNGFAVLPMAIDRDILVAGAPAADGMVRLANNDIAFGAREYSLSLTPQPYPAGDWGNYHKAATAGLLEWLGTDSLRGGDFLFAGNLPSGAGLSSSAAFVMGSALALLAVNDRKVRPAELAERMASAERYVGTLSGGMDQAICALGQEGRALRIDFDPLRTRPVPIGTGCQFVVCHSRVHAEKSGAAKAAYNQRVMECRIGCRVLDKYLGFGVPSRHLAALAARVPGYDLVGALAELLPDGALSLEEIATRSGLRATTLAGEIGLLDFSGVRFRPVARVRHVLTEAKRVDQAEAALAVGDWLPFGQLMNESHVSCRDNYEISCPAIESLVAAALEAGALGSRLTGAGFGGCTVNLVESHRVETFVDEIEGYYSRIKSVRGSRTGHEDIFVFRPSAGATVEVV